MDCIIPLIQGLEDVCSKDIAEILSKEPVQENTYCLISDITPQDVATLAYTLQSGVTIMPLLGRAKKFPKINLDNKELLQKVMREGMTFAVRSIKDKQETISSEEIHEEIGGVVSEWLTQIGISPKVSLSNPDITFLVLATGKEFLVGIDVVGFKLCKRPYKLFQHPASLNGCIAYGIAKEAGITKDNVVLDPCCGTGTIPIEVALYQQNMSPFHFENKFAGLAIPYFKEAFEKKAKLEQNKKATKSKVFGFDAQLKMMTGAKQNAKIAGIKDGVTFSKVSVDWIDAKFEKGEVDVIITQPPMISERIKNEKEVLKLYDELCYQAKYLLHKKGTLGVFVNHPEKFKEVATKHKLSFKKEIAVPLGENTFTLVMHSL